MRSFFTLFSFLFVLVATSAANGVQCSTSVSGKQALTPTQKAYEKMFIETYSVEQAARLRSEFHEEYVATEKDLSGGPEKLAALSVMGIKKNGHEYEVPDFLGFLSHYRAAHKALKRPESQLILPAVVMVLGEPGKIREYRLITPSVDPWPTQEGYRFLDSTEVFNIPFRSVLTGLKQKRFPMLDSYHDIAHFIAFYLNPQYAAKLVEMVEKLPALEKYPLSFGRRLFFALEFLTLGNPAKIPEMRETLLFPRIQGNKKDLPFSDYLSFFRTLPTKKLLAHAQRLSETYDTFLSDYGGATFRSFEKNELTPISNAIDLRNDPAMSLFHMLGSFRSELSDIQYSQMGTLPSLVLQGLIKIHAAKPKEFREIIESNSFIEQHFQHPAKDKDQMIELIALQVARMEYGLWESAKGISAERWLEETLQVYMKPDSKVYRFVLDFYGAHSPLTQVFNRSFPP